MTDIDQIHEEVRVARKWALIQRIGVVCVLVAVVAGIGVLGVRDHFRGQAVSNLGSALDQTRNQVTQCAKPAKERPSGIECSEPVAPSSDVIIEEVPGPVGPVGPPGEPGTDGQDGERGPGPTSLQVQAAVNLYCETGRCDGESPSTQQVSAAVALYCDARGQCKGPTGPVGPKGESITGEAGQDGSNGQDGKDGNPPSEGQVLAAVNTYCSNQPGGTCKGERGETGATGDTGATGPAGPIGEPGTPAVPFTFTFVVPGLTPNSATTYDCSITAPNTTAECIQRSAA